MKKIVFYVVKVGPKGNFRIPMFKNFSDFNYPFMMLITGDDIDEAQKQMNVDQIREELIGKKSPKTVVDGLGIGHEIFFPDSFFVQLFANLLSDIASGGKKTSELEDGEYEKIISAMGYDKKKEIIPGMILKYEFGIY